MADTTGRMIEIASDGGSMPAYLVRPPNDAPAPAVLVIMEAFGLNEHIKDVTRRLAAEGYVALAPDVYWRSGKGTAVGYDELPKAIALMQGLKDEQVLGDIRSAIAYLGKQPFVRADRIGITGFCMGGRITYEVAAGLPDGVHAAAPFYGGGIDPGKAGKVRAPMLAFFGEEDPFIPLENVDKLRSELARHGKQAEVVVYPKAPHGFFCNERDSYRPDAAKDAWERLKQFFAKHLKR